MKGNFIIKAVISALLFYYIVHDVDFGRIVESIKSADHLILVFAFFLHFIGLMLSSFRWKILLRAQKINIGIMYLFRSYLVATFFNHFLPSTIGGDSVRAYDSWKTGENKENALTVVILDRFLGLLTLLIFAIISIIFSPDLSTKIPGINFWVIVLSLGALILIWFIFSPPIRFISNLGEKDIPVISKISGFINKIDNSFNKFSNKKDKIIYSILLSILLQLNVVFYYFLISESLGLGIEFIDYFLIVPLTIFITMIPISLNGIGLRENALFLFLAPFSVIKAEAVAFAWVEYGMLLVLGIIGGIVYTLRK